MIEDGEGSQLARLRADEAVYQASGTKPKWLHLEILRRIRALSGHDQKRLRVYDVGCASGGLLRTLSDVAKGEFELLGSDISESLLDEALALAESFR